MILDYLGCNCVEASKVYSFKGKFPASFQVEFKEIEIWIFIVDRNRHDLSLVMTIPKYHKL
jgi:hypothetical protein